MTSSGFWRRISFNGYLECWSTKTAETGPGALAEGGKVTKAYLAKLPQEQWFSIRMESDDLNIQLERTLENLEQLRGDFADRLERKRLKLAQGDDLAPGVLKMVKVYLAVKRRIQPGDKMAGRHGNKGVVATIVPVEDMPYMEEGTPVDIVLNPLGVPSRMNVGQVLETHLGWAAKGLGLRIGEMLEASKPAKKLRGFLDEVYNGKGDSEGRSRVSLEELSDDEITALAGNLKGGVPMATPVFDGASEAELKSMLRLAGFAGERPDHIVTTGAPGMPSSGR